MKIIYVPIENLPQRYTQMMNDAITPLVDITLYPNIPVSKEIKKGQFLDIISTCKFKAAQLSMISDLFESEAVEAGDVFLIGDIFFPGIEMIKYMSELQGLDVKVYGINYAGRADETDFVQQLGPWADASEEGWHILSDGIFVGSEFHKNNVCKYFGIPEDYVFPTGYVWSLDYMNSFKDQIGESEKEEFVIWPHRFSEEKGIKELKYFCENTKKKVIITSSGPAKDLGWVLPPNVEYRTNLTKLEYFSLMSSAKWYLGTQKQETMGYTIQEAIFFGCHILIPDNACCSEMVPKRNVYNDISEVDYFFDHYDLTVPIEWTQRFDNNAQTMINIIKGLPYKLPQEIFPVKFNS